MATGEPDGQAVVAGIWRFAERGKNDIEGSDTRCVIFGQTDRRAGRRIEGTTGRSMMRG